MYVFGKFCASNRFNTLILFVFFLIPLRRVAVSLYHFNEFPLFCLYWEKEKFPLFIYRNDGIEREKEKLRHAINVQYQYLNKIHALKFIFQKKKFKVDHRQIINNNV